MRERIEVIKDIIDFKGNLTVLKNELNQYPYDCDEPLFIITNELMIEILQKTIKGHIPTSDLEKWSDILEVREDVSFENEYIHNLIFDFTFAYLDGGLKKKKLIKILEELEKL